MNKSFPGIVNSIQSFSYNVGKWWVTSGLETLQRFTFEKNLIHRTELKQIGNQNETYFSCESNEKFEIAFDRKNPSEFNNLAGDYEEKNSFVVKVNHAVTDTRFGVVFCPRGLIVESVSGSTNLLNYCVLKEILEGNLSEAYRLFTGLHKIEPNGLSTPIVPLLGVFSSNYYHWTLQYLPKLRAIDHYRKRTGIRPTLLIESDPADWQLETMDIFCPKYKLLEWQGSPIRAPAIIPAHRSTEPSDYEPPVSDYKWLKSKAESAVSFQSECTPKRIYLSREDAKSRRVRNESELMNVLDTKGFTRILASEYDVRSQIRIFANADVLIGPHGAAFSNLIYADDTSVIELFQRDNIRPYFFALSDIFGFNYDWSLHDRAGDDLVVNVDRVERQVERIIETV